MRSIRSIITDFEGGLLEGVPELAVIIPTLDEERTIEDCLESVGNASDVQVIVSDGGSTDATTELAARQGARVITGPPGRGPQLNRGARATRAANLLFLHADCRLPEGWFAEVLAALAPPETTLTCFRLHTDPAGGGDCSRLRRAWLRLLDLRSRGIGLPYGDQAFAVRREVFKRIGGFPEIPLMEDLVFAQTCRRLGHVHRLRSAVTTSARRFQRHPVRSRLMTATFPVLFRLGVSPDRLARLYGNVR
jgi:rSAM/selenodomain-associated transferase 2